MAWPDEQWAIIPGYPELSGCKISDQGRFMRRGRVYSATDIVDDYVNYRVQVGGVRKRYAASALVLTAFVGPRPEGQVARHLNDDRSDNRLVNLEWGTLSENSYDAVRNGRNWEANKTRCVRGHLLESPNLEMSVIHRRRMCKACHMVEVNRATDPPGGRSRFNRSRYGFLRRAGESKADEADRRYAHIMRDTGRT